MAEHAPTRPLSPYGSSKLMTEIMLHDTASAHGMNYIVLRYFKVAGADPKGRVGFATVGATHLLKIAVEAAIGQRAKIDVFGTDYPTPDGTCVRDYIHVTDLAQAHILALERLRAGHGSDAFNLGNGKGFSVSEVLATAERVTGRSIRRTAEPRRAGDPHTLVGSAAKAQRVLGWRPRFADLGTILETAWKWEQRRSGRG